MHAEMYIVLGVVDWPLPCHLIEFHIHIYWVKVHCTAFGDGHYTFSRSHSPILSLPRFQLIFYAIAQGLGFDFALLCVLSEFEPS